MSSVIQIKKSVRTSVSGLSRIQEYPCYDEIDKNVFTNQNRTKKLLRIATEEEHNNTKIIIVFSDNRQNYSSNCDGTLLKFGSRLAYSNIAITFHVNMFSRSFAVVLHA